MFPAREGNSTRFIGSRSEQILVRTGPSNHQRHLHEEQSPRRATISYYDRPSNMADHGETSGHRHGLGLLTSPEHLRNPRDLTHAESSKPPKHHRGRVVHTVEEYTYYRRRSHSDRRGHHDGTTEHKNCHHPDFIPASSSKNSRTDKIAKNLVDLSHNMEKLVIE